MRRRQGTILVAVLVIVTLCALAAATLMYRAQAEITASVAGGRRQQAAAVASTAMRRVMAILSVARADRAVWYDNPDLLKKQRVAFDGVNTWYFTVYAYNPTDPETLRNGLTDEASKINLNVASESILMNLPNMTTEQVDCLLDYRDSDEETRPEGAEQDYYSQLTYPYLIKNSLLGTLEEALLVKGFTATLLYGEDYNLNGLLEENEDDAEDSFPPDNADGILDRGLLGLATVVSYERNVANDGQARININQAQQIGQAGLPQQTAQFIEQYLAEGNTFSHPAELLEMQYQLQNPAAAAGGGGRGRRGRGGPQANPNEPQIIESGVGAAELPDVLDKLTTEGQVLMGKVNVNTASATVLAALPGIDEDLADRIVSARQDLDPTVLETPAWLYTENIVPADTFKAIAPMLTARSYQFHVRCVAYGWPCGQFRVVEAIIDVASEQPRIMYQRDLTRLGVPFAIDIEQEEETN